MIFYDKEENNHEDGVKQVRNKMGEESRGQEKRFSIES